MRKLKLVQLHTKAATVVKMIVLALCLTISSSAIVFGQKDQSNGAPKHDLEFWQQVISDDFALAKNENAFALTKELSGLFASTDPVLRDEIAYRIITNWIYRKKLLNPEELAVLVTDWSSNLPKGVGESDTDSVLLRSFSALNLATIVALDNENRATLDNEQFAKLLTAGIELLDKEQDLRGWTVELGWIHSTAHTADLLKFLGRSRHLKATQHQEILYSIAKRLGHTDGYIFIHDEDARLSAAVMSILNREDFQEKTFETFLKTLDEQSSRDGTKFDMDRFAAQQNKKNFLRSLYFQLATKPDSDEQALAMRATLLKRLSR